MIFQFLWVKFNIYYLILFIIKYLIHNNSFVNNIFQIKII